MLHTEGNGCMGVSFFLLAENSKFLTGFHVKEEESLVCQIFDDTLPSATSIANAALVITFDLLVFP